MEDVDLISIESIDADAESSYQQQATRLGVILNRIMYTLEKDIPPGKKAVLLERQKMFENDRIEALVRVEKLKLKINYLRVVK